MQKNGGKKIFPTTVHVQILPKILIPPSSVVYFMDGAFSGYLPQLKKPISFVTFLHWTKIPVVHTELITAEPLRVDTSARRTPLY
jgi:hypothetical protein